MPFYEYECQACKYYAEVMQKISDAPLIKCPSCGKKALKKLVSAPVFRLKGGGWYETDFKSEKESKRNLLGADKEETKPADSKPEAKEAKPEAKAGKEPASKAADAKADAAKPPAAEATAGASRKRVSVPVKAARSRPASRAGRAGARRSAARRRR
jgi:putative FmdB family regulatory protein